MDDLMKALMGGLGGGGGRDPEGHWLSVADEKTVIVAKQIGAETRHEPGTKVLVPLESRKDSLFNIGIVLEHLEGDYVEKNSGAPFYSLNRDTVVAMLDTDGNYDEDELDIPVLPSAALIPVTWDLNDQEQRQLEKLEGLVALFNQKETFEPGDVVTWKKSLRNRKQEGTFVFGGYIKDPKVLVADEEKGRSEIAGDRIDGLVVVKIGGKSRLVYGTDTRRLTKVEGYSL